METVAIISHDKSKKNDSTETKYETSKLDAAIDACKDLYFWSTDFEYLAAQLDHSKLKMFSVWKMRVLMT